MFVYTVYPTPGVKRKQPARRVGPVSRVKATTPIESDGGIRYDNATPPGQAFELSGIVRDQNRTPGKAGEFGSFQIAREQSDREPPIGEFHMRNILPVLLAWRQPKTVTASDFIVKQHDMLRAVQAGRNRGSYINRKRTYAGKK